MADYTLTTGADTFPAGEDVSGDDRIYGLAGDDVLSGGPGADLLDGGDGFDTVTYAGATVGIFVNPMSRVNRNEGTGDTFVSIERFVLSGLDDYFRADPSFTAGFEADGGAGRDRIYATTFSDTLDGGEGDDELRGGDGDDIVRGGAGNDLLHGEGGRDKVYGEAGDDLIYGGTNHDRIDGGEGIDTLVLYDGPGSYELSLLGDGSVRILRIAPEYEDAGTITLNGSFDIVTDIERIRYYDGTIFDLAAWIASGSAPAGFNVVRGTDGDEDLAGTTDQDALYGLAGSDSLAGGGGDDLLSGGGGADAFDGGDGVDTVTYGSASGPVSVGVPKGPFDSTDPTHEAFGDTFTGIERIELTALNDQLYWLEAGGIAVLGHGGADVIVGGVDADALDGGDGDDVLNARAGNDVLNGGGGMDRLEGGDGDDRLDGGLGSDIVNGGLGYDTLVFEGRVGGVSIGTSDGEDRGYNSIEAFRLTGFDDRIRLYASYNDEGHAAVSDVYAGAGNDLVDGGVLAGSLYGENGNDTLIAGHYGSRLDGGAGDDALHSAWGGDLIEGGDGSDTVHYDRPQDEYHIERDGDAIVVAHMASGWVDRLTGVETLSFPDPVFLERVIVGVSSIGANESVAALRTGSLTADAMSGEAMLANSLFGLSGADRLTGGGASDMISGGDDDDFLAGGAGDDSLYGGAGNDVLSGEGGADTLTGGAGNDRFIVDHVSDTAIEASGGGVDLVQSAVSYVLATELENLTLLGSGAINGTGNGLDNTIAGNAAANVLNGGGGADMMTGGAGNDIYVIDTAGDRAFERAGGGVDTVQSMVSVALAGEVENLVLLGAGAINGTGNTLANVITGNGAANVLNGGAGADMMTGGAGNDTYVFDSSGDRAFERGGGGTDIVQSNVSVALGGELENLVLVGAGAIYGIGNTLANQLTGNAGDNRLTGGIGADLLNGGSGGNDVFTYASTAESTAAARDTITGFDASDLIDLGMIDANGAGTGNGAFTFVGAAAFSHAAGELRAYQSGTSWFVEGDTDGDGAADLVIALTSLKVASLGAGDFVL